MSAGLIAFLILGTTVYMMLFKREFMFESHSRMPKIFLGLVCMFSVLILALTFGYMDQILLG